MTDESGGISLDMLWGVLDIQGNSAAGAGITLTVVSVSASKNRENKSDMVGVTSETASKRQYFEREAAC